MCCFRNLSDVFFLRVQDVHDVHVFLHFSILFSDRCRSLQIWRRSETWCLVLLPSRLDFFIESFWLFGFWLKSHKSTSKIIKIPNSEVKCHEDIGEDPQWQDADFGC
jgi:hypothetical protein